MSEFCPNLANCVFNAIAPDPQVFEEGIAEIEERTASIVADGIDITSPTIPPAEEHPLAEGLKEFDEAIISISQRVTNSARELLDVMQPMTAPTASEDRCVDCVLTQFEQIRQ